MQYRALGRTGFEVSTISFGAWAIGGTWGNVDDAESLRALHKALDLGVNFFDTADVYGGGRSEALLGKLKRERKEPFLIATKAGRGGPKHDASVYNRENLTAWVERSLGHLGVETIDLLQLHCPPTDVYYRPEVFGVLDELVKAGKLRFYGVSVERVEEALKAIEYPGVQSVQIIFNLFRQHIAEEVFAKAAAKGVAIIVRVPLASGLLSGKFTATTTFAEKDHRHYNADGAAFNAGETFSGIEFSRGVAVADQMKPLLPGNMATAAIRWILDHPEVTTVIPGASKLPQVTNNNAASDMAPLNKDTHHALRVLYNKEVLPFIRGHY